MSQTIGQPPIEITLRRTARARRFSLRVGQADGRVTISLPLRAREAEAMDFARAHEGWIRNALAKLPHSPALVVGGSVMVEGQPFIISHGAGRLVRIDEGHLIVPAATAHALVRTPAKIAAFLKVRARDKLAAACDFYAAQIDRKVTAISLRDTRSRWGSCSPKGALMFNWRLIMAPPAVLNYVAAHEVAHLLEMNHSPAFWAVVTQLYPNWQVQRDWLKRHGGALQAVRFDVAQPIDQSKPRVTG